MKILLKIIGTIIAIPSVIVLLFVLAALYIPVESVMMVIDGIWGD